MSLKVGSLHGENFPFTGSPVLVSPGEAAWGKSLILETILGACVGVAIYDLKRNIGGLLHAILPEGSPEKEAEYPYRYVRSGIQALYQEILALGGKNEDLVAVVTGGASVLREPDRHAVGARNALASRRYLKELAIPVIREDVGGHFPRRLLLDLNTLKVKITSSSRKAVKGPDPQETPRTAEIQRLEERIDRLHPQTELALKVWRLARDPTVNFENLEQEILKDQALTANILKVSNSAFYGLKEKVSSLSRAIAFLGLETFRRVVMVSALAGVYDRDLPGYQLERKELFRHALACAMISELIARRIGIKEGEEIYIAGLIHDIGKILLDEFARDLFDQIIRLVLFHNRLFLEAERELIGTDHATVGGIVAQRWGFPPALLEAIIFHHEPSMAPSNPEVAAVVHLANIVASYLGVSGGQGSFSNPLDPGAMEILSLDDMDSILDEACGLVNTIF